MEEYNPTSHPEHKELIKEWASQIDKAHVIDLGAGTGTYLDLIGKTRKEKWTAVEIFEPSVVAHKLRDKYDQVVVADMRYVDWSLVGRASLVIAGDVIEHISEGEGIALIERLQAHAENIIVSIPLGEYEQGEIGGNIHETHLATYEYEQMLAILARSKHGRVVASAKGDVLGAFWWQRH